MTLACFDQETHSWHLCVAKVEREIHRNCRRTSLEAPFHSLNRPSFPRYYRDTPYTDMIYSMDYVVLVFWMPRTKISDAPTLVSSSITIATFFFSTMDETATHPSSSSAVIVGARFPGVILQASDRSWRGMLYWQRTYFCAANVSISSQWTSEQAKFLGMILTDNATDSAEDQTQQRVVQIARFDQDRRAVNHSGNGF